jgi:hypothetical protein
MAIKVNNWRCVLQSKEHLLRRVLQVLQGWSSWHITGIVYLTFNSLPLMHRGFSSVNILSEDPVNELLLVAVKRTSVPNTIIRPYFGVCEFTHFNWNELFHMSQNKAVVLLMNVFCTGVFFIISSRRYSGSLQSGRSRDRISAETKFSALVQTGHGAKPASCTRDRGALSQGKAARAWRQPHNPN